MKPPTRIPLRLALPRASIHTVSAISPMPPARPATAPSSSTLLLPLLPVRTRRPIHDSARKPANVAPILGTGPPPAPPVPEGSTARAELNERVARRRRQAELLARARQIRSAEAGKSKASSDSALGKAAPVQRRFWKNVSVQEVDGAIQVHLDSRPLRHPTSKGVVRLPRSKTMVATALAIEWDAIGSTTQATRHHLVPLTSLVCRATDIAEDDARHRSGRHGGGLAPIRESIVATLMRYLDTDSLLCWAPVPSDERDVIRNAAGETLRDVQRRTAGEVLGFLAAHVWPGVELEPVLDEHSIVPRRHPEGATEVVRGWIAGLEPWDLAGLERAALAGKSLVAAARLVVEWSEGPAGVGPPAEGGGERRKRFGAEEAARATNLEVDWQTGRWGEVEDTHDVEREDLRRQFGAVVLLVMGSGEGA